MYADKQTKDRSKHSPFQNPARQVVIEGPQDLQQFSCENKRGRASPTYLVEHEGPELHSSCSKHLLRDVQQILQSGQLSTVSLCWSTERLPGLAGVPGASGTMPNNVVLPTNGPDLNLWMLAAAGRSTRAHADPS